MKATPYTRACWASNCGANSGVCDLGDPLNKTVVSHCAMSHGLDRGAYWRAALVQGCVGMSRGEGFEEVYEALRVFQPFQFCTMPCFWEALYKHAQGRMEGLVREGLEREGWGGEASALLAREQLGCMPSLLLQVRCKGGGGGGWGGRPTSPPPPLTCLPRAPSRLPHCCDPWAPSPMPSPPWWKP